MKFPSKLVLLSAAAAFAAGLSVGGVEAHEPDRGEALLPTAAGFGFAGGKLAALAPGEADLSEASEAIELASQHRRPRAQQRRAGQGRSARQGRSQARQQRAGPSRSARSRSSRRSRRGRDIGTGLAIGVGAAILGSMLSQQGAQAQGADAAAFEAEVEDAMYACDDRFRSFDWDTGTFTTYGGEVRLCPYLEPYVNY